MTNKNINNQAVINSTWTESLANTYYRDGARVINSPTMVSGDWQKFMPNVKPGEVADSPLNPICWPIDDK